MDKLILEFPTLEELKQELEKGFPDKIEVTFKDKKDNIEELNIIFYLINKANYRLDKLESLNDLHTIYLGIFKRNID